MLRNWSFERPRQRLGQVAASLRNHLPEGRLRPLALALGSLRGPRAGDPARSLDPDFVADCPYGPDGILFDRIVAIDRDENLIRVQMSTHAGLPLTRAQREHPVLHPRHVNGGLMVHMTGMVGFAHAYYLLGLRHREGWVGYGAVIHKARYPALAPVGDPLDLEARALRVRQSERRAVIRYAFRFTQGEATVYESEQTAMFMRPD